MWKSLLGFEDYFEISSDGFIRNKKNGKVRKGNLDKDGYLTTNICGKSLKMHRLVAINFINNEYNKPTVNHINGIKSDNRVENLEWSTRSENMYHAYKLKLKKPVSFKGVDNSSAKLTEKEVKEILSYPKHITHNFLANKYNVTFGLIGMIRRRVIWKHLK